MVLQISPPTRISPTRRNSCLTLTSGTNFDSKLSTAHQIAQTFFSTLANSWKLRIKGDISASTNTEVEDIPASKCNYLFHNINGTMLPISHSVQHQSRCGIRAQSHNW